MPETIPTLFDHAAPSRPPILPAPHPSGISGAHVARQVVVAMAAGGALLWGIWATHTILTLRNSSPHLVKVDLADLVREYVQREARSGGSAEDLTMRTASFLKALNTAVSAHVHRGDVVLLGNAVVDGDVPDITAAVRSAVYGHQPRASEPTQAPADAKQAGQETDHGH